MSHDDLPHTPTDVPDLPQPSLPRPEDFLPPVPWEWATYEELLEAYLEYVEAGGELDMLEWYLEITKDAFEGPDQYEVPGPREGNPVEPPPTATSPTQSMPPRRRTGVPIPGWPFPSDIFVGGWHLPFPIWTWSHNNPRGRSQFPLPKPIPIPGDDGEDPLPTPKPEKTPLPKPEPGPTSDEPEPLPKPEQLPTEKQPGPEPVPTEKPPLEPIDGDKPGPEALPTEKQPLEPGDKQPVDQPTPLPDLETPKKPGILERPEQEDNVSLGQLFQDILTDVRQNVVTSVGDTAGSWIGDLFGPGASEKSGTEIGERMAEMFEAAYPGTNPWERLGATGAGGAMAGSDSAQATRSSADTRLLETMIQTTPIMKRVEAQNATDWANAELADQKTTTESYTGASEFHRSQNAKDFYKQQARGEKLKADKMEYAGSLSKTATEAMDVGSDWLSEQINKFMNPKTGSGSSWMDKLNPYNAPGK